MKRSRITASRITAARGFLVLAALPPVVLGILVMLGAHEDVSVVMTGGGSRAALGAAWVVTWLASLILTPIAAGASLVSFALDRSARAT